MIGKVSTFDFFYLRYLHRINILFKRLFFIKGLQNQYKDAKVYVTETMFTLLFSPLLESRYAD